MKAMQSQFKAIAFTRILLTAAEKAKCEAGTKSTSGKNSPPMKFRY
jgi:hypothetical protein